MSRLLFDQFRIFSIKLLLAISICSTVFAQSDSTSKPKPSTTSATVENPSAISAPATVDVAPVANDEQINNRLKRILTATTWFRDIQLHVEEGVVFIEGATANEDHRKWASDLARNTQDVVAVVNRLEVDKKRILDISPAVKELETLGRDTIQLLPLLIVGILILIVVWFLSGWSVRASRKVFQRRLQNPLLTSVLSKAVAIPVFLVGLYLAFRVSGLTQIAATVLGGTGLVGLIIGIAFRDIAENFLASILISIQRPFAIGDMIDVNGSQGLVQSVTARGTLLMSPDGNHIQIPNSAIYKSIIKNFTANPNQRCEFTLTVTKEDSLQDFQDLALGILQSHEAVLSKPEPLVLVDEYTQAGVNLKVCFWIDGQRHSKQKARSAVIRLCIIEIEKLRLESSNKVKLSEQSLIQSNYFDGANEKIPVHANGHSDVGGKSSKEHPVEHDLESEKEELVEQARNARAPEEGANLLEDKPLVKSK